MFWRFIRNLVVASIVIYAITSAALYAAMRQTPERFGAIMAHVPGAAMMVLPFKPLWMSARRGDIRIGDLAPDFTLPDLHGSGKVTLSQEYRHKPVVLVFGSYT